MCAWRELALIAEVLRQQLQKLLLVLADELRQLRVARANLLKDRLQHLRLLLHQLTQLLEVRVISQEVQIPQLARFSTARSGSSPGPGTGASSSLPLAGARLSSSFKQIHRLVAADCRCGGASGTSRRGGRAGCSAGSSSTTLRCVLLSRLGNALRSLAESIICCAA